ncbi:hypothetical protein SCHPADRAFT_945554 [Schizopora paradoxa]|uniref:Protein SirB1 N-terminal domain-containing protein n=1 Tax=Schizopora paradoxa TaxID=27342 RepID=A0A0H2R5G6_9AGAM|nr:hypothetical protein SCHPADRAFT_945554 [Schizopora paradoxa]
MSSSSSSNDNYPWLPLELLSKIFDELPLDDESAVILARSMQANRLFSRTIADMAIWELLYGTRYIHHDHTREMERIERLGSNWYLRYAARRRIDRIAMEGLRNIVHATELDQHFDMVRKVLRFGSDVWDALKQSTKHPLPVLFQSDDDIELVIQGRTLTTLTTRYWSQELLGLIARQLAMKTWTALSRGEMERTFPLDECLSYLSAFYDVHPDDVMNMFESLADDCRKYLDDQEIIYQTKSPDFDEMRVALAICEFLKNRGFRLAEGNHFFRVQNSFPHFFLAEYKETLPMSLVCCFVAIARRLGIPSAPLNTQHRVLACLGETIVDVCEGRLLQSVQGVRNVQMLLSDVRVMNDMSVLMLGRSARNIRNAFTNSTEYYDVQSTEPRRLYQKSNAMYASRCISAHVDPDSRPDGHSLMTMFFSAVMHRIDNHLPLTESFNPGNSNDYETFMQEVDANSKNHWFWPSPSREHRRSQCLLAPPFFVGQIARLRHDNNTLCVIVGWKPVDGNSGMFGILRWNGNLYQGIEFESAKAVIPIQVTREALRAMYRDNPYLGHYFVDAEIICDPSVGDDGEGRARFLMNDMFRRVYPDDDAVGAAWVRS